VRIGVAGVGAVVVTFAVWATPAIAQRYPLLDSTAVAMLSGEISGDAAYDHVRVLSGFHRPQGSDTLGVAARYVERMAKEFGLAKVRYIELPSERQTWNPGKNGSRAPSRTGSISLTAVGRRTSRPT